MTKSTRSPQSLDTLIGLAIRARRLECGVSQERLAELIGVTFQQVQKYEKGINRVSASRLHRIAGALSTKPGAFYPDDEFSEATFASGFLQDRDVIRIAGAISRVPILVRAPIIRAIEAFCKVVEINDGNPSAETGARGADVGADAGKPTARVRDARR